MKLASKIKKQVLNNGIKGFGYTKQDLNKFTHDEVAILCNYGFITNEDKTEEYMKRGI